MSIERTLIDAHYQNLINFNEVLDTKPKIKKYLDFIKWNFKIIRRLGEPIRQSGTDLIDLLTSKLNEETRNEWQNSRGKGSKDSVGQFLKFLNRYVRNTEFPVYDNVTSSSSRSDEAFRFISKAIGDFSVIPRPRFNETFLTTVLIDIYDSQGKTYEARAMLDTGASKNFIVMTLCFYLKLEMRDVLYGVTGVGNSQFQVRKATKAKISSKVTDFSTELTFLTIDGLNVTVPEYLIPRHQFTIPQGIKLADPHFNKPQAVEIILGIDVFFNILKCKKVVIDDKHPKMINTDLGWVVGGRFYK